MLTLDSLNLQNISPEELGEILIEAKKAYYTSGKPIMDDHTYDTFEDILRQKSPYHRIFSKVGNPNFDTGFEKKKHTIPMGSQNKVTNYADLVHYFELKKINIPEFIIQPKCDGISVEIEYKHGVLVDAITRGDGLVGDVITQNIVKMKNFISSPKDFSGSIRCEIMVTKKDFEKLNKIVETLHATSLQKEEGFYSNPRNAASGISQRLDSKFSEFCSLYAVDISTPTNESDKINLLTDLGFTTVESSLCHNFDEIESIFQEFFTTKRDSYPFEIDGLVIKINDINLAQSLGIKNNRPQYQVAYKFPASTNTTTIKSVTWQVGPLGAITPVAEVEPIELSGTIITFASLANHDLVKKMDLNISDIVKISRRGDVIPHIEEVVTKVNSGYVNIPTLCPSCHTLLTVEDKFLRCSNINCLPQIIGCLNLFCQTLEILGISEKTITKLYDSGRVKLPGDFYKLTIEDIKDLDNLGEKSAKNILNQIDKKRVLSLVEIFDSAIIPNFSKKRIQQLINAGFDTPDKLLNLKINNLLQIKGFKVTLAQKIISGINLRRSWIESILSQVETKALKFQSSKALEGFAFCITGDLSIPRKQIEQIIIDNGGSVQSTVSKNTNYLITNQESDSSKYITAKKLNIPILNEDDFKSFSESATLLAERIKLEELSSFDLCYVNFESAEFVSLVANNFNQPVSLLDDPHTFPITKKYLVILDRGDTLGEEYNEYTDILHQLHPNLQIVLAVPVIPSAEEQILKDSVDILLYLHSEPNFFSINQFYQT